TGRVGETMRVGAADLDARRFGCDDGATRSAKQKLFLVAAERRRAPRGDRLFLLVALKRPDQSRSLSASDCGEYSRPLMVMLLQRVPRRRCFSGSAAAVRSDSREASGRPPSSSF